MLAFWFPLLLCCGMIFNFAANAISSGVSDYSGLLTEEERKELCAAPTSGHSWIISQKKTDYGWGEQTHRALIVLALNDFGELRKNNEEILLLQHQLEVELTKALVRNDTQQMLISDLALYIHALIITGKDPRDFYDLDLVEILKGRLHECSPSRSGDINAYALLVLSDSRAIETSHLETLRNILASAEGGRKQKELKALALHALACALDGGEFQQYSRTVEMAAASLAESQNQDGSFGNLYTTALVVQALVAAQYTTNWNERDARDFLSRKSKENVNMVSTYYTERALNAHKARCFKVLYKAQTPRDDGLTTLREIRRWPKHHYVQYTVRTSDHPDTYFTATVNVPVNATFFDIMRMIEAEDAKFRFSWYLNKEGYPVVYSISGVPNNAEESLYWRLIEESDADHNRLLSVKQEHTDSPMLLYPKRGSHLIYTYTDAFKPVEKVY